MAAHSTTSVVPQPLNGKATTLPETANLLQFLQTVIDNKRDDQKPFHVLDLTAVESLMDRWTTALPHVLPFYAVKCFPDPSLLAKMAALGAGFDCASCSEIEAVLSVGGVSPHRIIFANTCKEASHLRFAAEAGVCLTTFDSEAEVRKIKANHPACELLIRIKTAEDEHAVFPMGKKFGALEEEVEPLLRAADAARLRVVGVSFHIGSGATRFDAFRAAIAAARKVFDAAARLGFPGMRLLNVGGGFSAAGGLFEDAADVIKLSIEEYFPDEAGLTCMAEPGRFFAGPVFTLVVRIIGKRSRGEVREYWINDGMYGSIKFYDGKVNPVPFACVSSPGARSFISTIYGPTCAAVDTVVTDCMLPELEIGDWLIFPKMGSYTKATGSNFNGFNLDSIRTYSVHISGNHV